MNKPCLKPWKGWRFRLVLCDENGHTLIDDFMDVRQAPEIAEHLTADYLRIKERQREIEANEYGRG